MQKKIKNQDLKKIRINLLKNILIAAYSAGASSAHLGGALSMIDIINIIFSKFINLNPNNIKDIDRDYFILSKGTHVLHIMQYWLKKVFLIKNY